MIQNTASALDRCASVGNNQTNPGVRFSLKKRSVRSNRDMVNLSSYNSDFLSGIFADVAKANVLPEISVPQKRGSELITSDSSDECSRIELPSPGKKSRTSLNRCMSRARASILNLTDITSFQSPKGINELFGPPQQSEVTKDKKKSLVKNHQHDSLAFQLNCVSAESTSKSAQVGDAAQIAFPHLPATVSDSSCSAGLTRANLVRNASTPEKETKECFGWFVDLDDNQTSTPEDGNRLPYAVSSDDLAFQAFTAPKRVNDEAELEWAKAADTVDDVLGDFF